MQKFSKEGKFLLGFGNKGNEEEKLNHPFGITTHDGKVYVADSKNRRISVFQNDSQFCTSFSSKRLGDPEDVIVNIRNQLLVADYEYHCIHIFNLNGHYITKFGVQGSDCGQLHHPRSLTTDSNGHIFVVDHNDRVSIFDKDGNFIHCFGSSGCKDGQFSSPYGIALGPKDSIYVCDHLNCRVQIFSIV